MVHGLDDTPGPKAYYIHLEAKPGKKDLLQAFLRDIRDMLAYPAQLYRLDVLHGKFGVMLGKPVKPA